MGRDQDRTGNRETAAERGRVAPTTILAVIEDPTIRQLVSEVFATAGWSSRATGEGRSAHELAEAAPIDALVADLFLPDTTGIDLAFDLREMVPDLAVVILETYRDGVSEEVFRLPAGAATLAKPFRPSELVERLEQLLADPAA